MSLKDLNIAYIQPVNGKKAGKPIQVLFNPAEYTIEKGNTFQNTSLPGLANPVTHFVTGNADTLTMELFFDTYTVSSRHSQANVKQGEDVRKYTKEVAELLNIDPSLHAPPVCQFVWGPPSGSEGKLQFTATIERLTQKFTMFLNDGTPVRATLNVTFKEYKTVKEQLEEIGRESADRTKRETVKEGDSLWLYAAREYRDAGLWRVIAKANKIENPRILATGQRLLIPPLEE